MMSSSWTFLNTTGSTSENKARTLNIYSIIYVTCTETLNQRNFSGMEIWTRKWFICTYFVKGLVILNRDSFYSFFNSCKSESLTSILVNHL